MNFRALMDLYSDWNGITVVNNDNLEVIVRDITSKIVESKRFDNATVVSFGFYDNEFCVRIK